MGLIKWIKSLFKKKESTYPQDYAIINYSENALQLGLSGDKNKWIYRYFINRFNNLELEKYRFSEERVKALQDTFKIPIFDKTQTTPQFPVFDKINPAEVRFTSK